MAGLSFSFDFFYIILHLYCIFLIIKEYNKGGAIITISVHSEIIRNLDCPKLTKRYPGKRAELHVYIIDEKYLELDECENKKECGAFLDNGMFNEFKCHFWKHHKDLIIIARKRGLII